MKALSLPAPPAEYDQAYMNELVRSLTLWGNQFNYAVSMSMRFIDARELPTVSILATIPSGAVYNDTGTLKVKP